MLYNDLSSCSHTGYFYLQIQKYDIPTPASTVTTPTTPTSTPATTSLPLTPANKPITLTQTVLRPATPGAVTPLTPTTPQKIRGRSHIVLDCLFFIAI